MNRDLMETTLVKIDRKIGQLEKLRKLRELMADPDVREFLWDQPSNGNIGSPRTQLTLPQPKKGDFGRKVYEVSRLLPQPFTVSDVQRELSESGYEFLAAKPEVAVGSAIRKLVKHHRVNMVSKGAGRIPNKYEVAEK
jgi:hypothetical protein